MKNLAAVEKKGSLSVLRLTESSRKKSLGLVNAQKKFENLFLKS